MHVVKFLRDAQSGHRDWSELWKPIKGYLLAGHRLEVEVRPERRTSEQSARFHAICSDLEASRLPWFGHPRTAGDWKVLLVSAHAVATKETSNVIPGLEGELVNLRESTALMSKKRGASLIEYSEAFCIAHDVPLRDPQYTEAKC